MNDKKNPLNCCRRNVIFNLQNSDGLIPCLGDGLSDSVNILRAASCHWSTTSILLFRLGNCWVCRIESFDNPVKSQLTRNIKWRNIKLLSKLSSDCLHRRTSTISEDDPSLLLHWERRWQRHDVRGTNCKVKTNP